MCSKAHVISLLRDTTSAVMDPYVTSANYASITDNTIDHLSTYATTLSVYNHDYVKNKTKVYIISFISHIYIAFFMLLFSSIHGNIISNHILRALYFVTLYDTALNFFELYSIGWDFFTQSSYNLRYVRKSSALYHILSVLDKKLSDSCFIPYKKKS